MLDFALLLSVKVKKQAADNIKFVWFEDKLLKCYKFRTTVTVNFTSSAHQFTSIKPWNDNSVEVWQSVDFKNVSSIKTFTWMLTNKQ